MHFPPVKPLDPQHIIWDIFGLKLEKLCFALLHIGWDLLNLRCRTGKRLGKTSWKRQPGRWSNGWPSASRPPWHPASRPAGVRHFKQAALLALRAFDTSGSDGQMKLMISLDRMWLGALRRWFQVDGLSRMDFAAKRTTLFVS